MKVQFFHSFFPRFLVFKININIIYFYATKINKESSTENKTKILFKKFPQFLKQKQRFFQKTLKKEL